MIKSPPLFLRGLFCELHLSGQVPEYRIIAYSALRIGQFYTILSAYQITINPL